MHKKLLTTLTVSFVAVVCSPATILVTEPFDYTAQTYAAGTWSGSVLSGSGIGWGTNAYFDHSGTAANFVIGGGAPTGTYFESAGQNYNSGTTYWRNRTMPTPVGNSSDGTVIWQSMLMWSDGSSGGGMKVHNNNGGTDYNILIASGNVYELQGGHSSPDVDTSAIAVSTDINTPDLLVFKIENTTGTGNQTVSLWVNPNSSTEGGLSAPDLSVSYVAFINNRNIGGINIAPGAIKLDEIVFTDDYADFGIGGPSQSIIVKDGTTPLPDGSPAPVDFGYTPVGVAVEKTFTIFNAGTTDLTLGTISKDGADAGDFAVGAPGTSVLPASSSTTFAVAFTPGTAGAKTAAIHIASDAPGDLNPFDVNLTGNGLSFTTDTDTDGLNDAAEFNLSALGFDWQVSQVALVDALFAGADSAGLFTESQVQALNVGVPLLARDPVSGQFTLTLGILKAIDLINFNPFPMTAPQTAINGSGELEFTFSTGDNAAFFRVEGN